MRNPLATPLAAEEKTGGGGHSGDTGNDTPPTSLTDIETTEEVAINTGGGHSGGTNENPPPTS